ncbi:MAG: UbiA-like polyprenyltransferase [Armatimonadota bacterium]
MKKYLSLVKFEHTVFALPFALTAAIYAGFPDVRKIAWIVLAIAGARTCAMTVNRIADARLDAANPRTRGREIPTGKVSFVEAWTLAVLSAALFVFSASRLNTLALALSPVALVVVVGYSWTKRFTSLSHLVLGLALAIAPAGAWIGVTGALPLAPIALSGGVMLWTAGFDIIYALQDLKFDAKMGLFSIPRALGEARALLVSRLFHILAVGLFAAFGALAGAGWLYFAGVGVVAAVLIFEQAVARSRTAFAFAANGAVSIAFLIFAGLDRWIG